MTARIVVNNARARIEGKFPFDEVDRTLRFRPDGYRFMPSYKYGSWDGYIRLLSNDDKNTFPAGCVPLVEEVFKAEECKYVIDDRRKKPPLPVKHTNDIQFRDGSELRPYQRKLIRTALQHGRGVLKSATGSGKTICTAGLIQALTGKRPPKTLIVVPNRRLVKQTLEELERFIGNEHLGFISQGKWEEDIITVALPNTLNQQKWATERVEMMKNVELLIIDECHHTPAATWYEVLHRCRAYYRFGLSGTPLDRDSGSIRLIGLTGPLLVNIEAEVLVEQGVLAKPFVEFVEVSKPELPETLKYDEVYKLGIVKNVRFHKKLVRKVAELADEGLTTLVLVNHLEHGRALSQLMQTTHIFVHAQMPEKRIERAVREFKKGKLPVLIASPIFGEGVDVPSIDALVVADGGKSVIKTIQKAGRAMRPKQGRPNQCRIVDFAHLTHKFLADHSLIRMQTYNREGYSIVNA